MADKKVSELTAITNMSSDDLLMVVNDPSGTPASRKITHGNFFANVATPTTFTSNVTFSSTRVTLSANAILNATLKNGSTTIIGSNGKLHANNAISANTITAGMITFAPVTNNDFQSYVANTNSRFVPLVANTDVVNKSSEVEQVMSSNLVVDAGNTAQLSTSGVHISNGAINIFSDTGSPSLIDFYCEVTNIHKVRLQAPAHAVFSGNVVSTLPVKSGNVATTNSEVFTGTTKTANLDVQDVFRITTKVSDFATSNAVTESVTAGSIYYSNTYLYVVTDSNTIKRVLLSTW